MKKNGFTLIELIGSVVILAIIALIAFPAIIGVLNEGEKKVDNSVKDLMVGAANKYVNEHINNYPKKLGDVAEGANDPNSKTYAENATTPRLTGQYLTNQGYLEPSVIEKNCKIIDDYVVVTSNTRKYFFEYKEVTTDSGCRK